MDTPNKLQFFSAAHPLGTTSLAGISSAALWKAPGVVLPGGRLTVVFGLVVGGTIGSIAGYYGGKIDEVIMKLIDTQMAFPGVLLA